MTAGVVLLALACSDEEIPPPQPYNGVASEARSAATSAEIEAALAALVNQLPNAHGQQAIDAHALLTQDFDQNCPAFFEEEGSLHWFGRCETDGGVYYSGAAFASDLALVELPADHWLNFQPNVDLSAPLTGEELRGQIDVFHPTLGVLRCSANYAVVGSETADVVFRAARSEGVCAWDQAEEGSWLRGGPEPALSYVSAVNRGANKRTLDLWGTMSLPEGPVPLIELRDVRLGATLSGCVEDVKGEVSARSASGVWTTLELVGEGCGLKLRRLDTGELIELDLGAALFPEEWAP